MTPTTRGAGRHARVGSVSARPSRRLEILVEEVVGEQVVAQVVPGRQVALFLREAGEQLALPLGEQLGRFDPEARGGWRRRARPGRRRCPAPGRRRRRCAGPARDRRPAGRPPVPAAPRRVRRRLAAATPRAAAPGRETGPPPPALQPARARLAGRGHRSGGADHDALPAEGAAGRPQGVLLRRGVPLAASCAARRRGPSAAAGSAPPRSTRSNFSALPAAGGGVADDHAPPATDAEPRLPPDAAFFVRLARHRHGPPGQFHRRGRRRRSAFRTRSVRTRRSSAPRPGSRRCILAWCSRHGRGR